MIDDEQDGPVSARVLMMGDEPKDALLQVEMFTDGACMGNPGPGGYGVVLKFGPHRKELFGAFQDTTNNRMELMAAIVGLRALSRRCHVKLITDSEYLAHSLSKGWAQRWRDNGWWRSANQRAANHDLWAVLLDLVARHEVTLFWTRGHAGDPENECCDRLAREAIGSRSAAPDEGYQQSLGNGPASIPERLAPRAKVDSLFEVVGGGSAIMEPTWKQADVFPVIARVIEQAYQEHQRFITVREIATRLLQDPEGRNLVAEAHEQQEEKQSLEWLASNMVSWFSQRMTIGESAWARTFERVKIDGLWAYKPVAAASQ
jgi:ribonuclease HI